MQGPRLEALAFAVLGNDDLVADVVVGQMASEVFAGQGTVVDGFHVDSDDLCVGSLTDYAHYVFLGHSNGIAVGKTRGACVQDSDLWVITIQDIFDWIAPDGV